MDTDYAETRMRNEPIVEMTQVKGDSETHPLLSPNDELPILKPCRFVSGHGSKASPMVLCALEPIWRPGNGGAGSGQPYRFGMIGASDACRGRGLDEDNYWSKSSLVDSNARLRGSVPMKQPNPDGTAYNINNFTLECGSGRRLGRYTRGDILTPCGVRKPMPPPACALNCASPLISAAH